MIKTLRQLHNDYCQAEGLLRKEVNALYPINTVGRCNVTGLSCRVTGNSLYADQINTTLGHMSWHNFEKIRG